ncbi:MAG TPA: diguanylate cyclase [Candidatus Acidoferrum sp.]|nr:diguanylate cyclase [Candidatus Acidoferrum sp.]
MAKGVPELPVLIADDSAVYRELVKQTLEVQPYASILAASGREALALYEKCSPSIVITDWMMPDFSGMELCRHIRANAQNPYTYIIVLTSVTEKENVVKGLAAGADDYLTKPFDRGELLARVGVGRRTVELHREIEAKNKMLEQMAYTDSLTGLPNRRAIEEWTTRQLRGAARHGFPLWVIHADLDCFKEINDNHGHESGDEVLKRFGTLLKANTRACDMSARVGGDEFLHVMTHVPEKDIHIAIERLRQGISSLKFCFHGEAVSVTASFGLSGFCGKELPDFWDLVGRADRALYAAKRAGRNQVQIASV